MCFEILVRDAIPSQRWPQKPLPLGTSERWGAVWGLRVPNLRWGGQALGCSPARWQRGKSFHAWPRRGTGMGADPAASPDHLPGGWGAQEGPKSPAAAREKQEGSDLNRKRSSGSSIPVRGGGIWSSRGSAPPSAPDPSDPAASPSPELPEHPGGGFPGWHGCPSPSGRLEKGGD